MRTVKFTYEEVFFQGFAWMTMLPFPDLGRQKVKKRSGSGLFSFEDAMRLANREVTALRGRILPLEFHAAS